MKVVAVPASVSYARHHGVYSVDSQVPPRKVAYVGGGHFLPVPHNLQRRGFSPAFPMQFEKFALSKMSPLAEGG